MRSAALPVCGSCDDTGWAFVEQDGVTRRTRCACWIAARQRYADGVPFEFQAASLDNYRAITGNQTAIEIAKKFAAGERDLYLCGGVGSGKTRLACSLLNAQHARDGAGYFARVPMLLWKLQPTVIGTEAVEGSALLRRLCTEPLIVLDDVGAERDSASDYTRRTLLTIYEERGDRQLRTIWTSNLRLAQPSKGPAKTNDEISARLNRSPFTRTLGEFMGDDRLASRIAGRADVIWIGASDQRIRRSREDRS